MEDVYEMLKLKEDEFSHCLEKIDEKNNLLFSERLGEENKLLSEINMILGSKAFDRAFSMQDINKLNQLTKDLYIGKCSNELKKIKDLLIQIVEKQLEDERRAVSCAAKTIPKELRNDFSELMRSDLFIRYFMGLNSR